MPLPNASQDNLPLAFFLMVGGVFVVGSMDVVAKLLSSELPLAQIVWGRFFFHTLLMLPIFLVIIGKNPEQRKQDWRGHLIRGILLMLSTVFYFAAIKENPIPDTIAIFFVEPIFVMFLAAIFLGERLRRHRCIAAFVAFIGVLIVLRPGGGAYTPTIWFALLAGLCFAGYIITTRKSSVRGSPLVTAWGTAAAALICTTPWLIGEWQTPIFREWILLILMGFLSATGHAMITYACRVADASLVAIFHYSEIIAATILSYFVFAHIPDGWVWVGVFFIAGSKIAVTVIEMREKKARLKSLQNME